MIRLAFVKFRALEKFADGTTSDEVHDSETRHIQLDTSTQIVYVGKKDWFPMAHVRRMEPAVKDVCDVCGEDFEDARGLGAHKRHVHGIPGARSLKKNEAVEKESTDE